MAGSVIRPLQASNRPQNGDAASGFNPPETINGPGVLALYRGAALTYQGFLEKISVSPALVIPAQFGPQLVSLRYTRVWNDDAKRVDFIV